LVETKYLTACGYRKLDLIKDEIVFEKEDEPKYVYVGHVVDDFCKYVRMTQKYKK
jgi:hypothetical protein